ncbi:MBOAT family O-acyltransferase [Mucilaginibacter arboris]|uniref:MBOAT family O-acyltransferase n=1 Tax=Mucilaginibacter arboris TaxID=2682090 RepID=UPI0018DD55FA|nr:MBOAT family O-acyltransferase [Mucilaginibacter arboris]
MRLQNLFLLVAGYVFYGWWDWRFLFLLIFSSANDFLLGKKIYNAKNTKVRKRWLMVSLFVNLGLLGLFKYFNFFTDSFTSLASKIGISVNWPTLHIILPVGLSFYTFQSLTYTIDIYKKKMEPTKDILIFFTFVGFFPQMVAGPIERARLFLPQFFLKRTFTYEMAKIGGRLILIGFFKKIVIADSLSILVNAVYNSPKSYTGFPTVVATIFFAFQIYCDFSGYSDIAIGTAKLLGFDLTTNFKMPYLSTSLTEFWHRWHISLSTWFRDYVYIPLGGNRTSNLKANFNIFITFVLSGFWHGANWTFIIWGAIHGFVLIVEKMLTIKGQKNENTFNKLISTLLSFIIVCFAWIFFRSNSLSDAFIIITKMFSDVNEYSNFLNMSLKFRGMGLQISDIFISLFFLCVLLTMELQYNNEKLRYALRSYRFLRWSVYYFLIISIVFSATKNPAGNFIYFQF